MTEVLKYEYTDSNSYETFFKLKKLKLSLSITKMFSFPFPAYEIVLQYWQTHKKVLLEEKSPAEALHVFQPVGESQFCTDRSLFIK